LPALESRLKGRYLRLVMEHLSPAQQLAAGLRSLPGSARPFAAATRAAWRFYANPRVGLPALAGPLIERARSGAAEACDRHVPVVLDWSAPHYPAHAGKADRIKLTSYEDFGYNLLTALAISDRDGGPPAPVCLELGARPTARAQHAGGHARVEAGSLLDGPEPVMRHVERQDPGRPVVWVIDREADSVGHYRRRIARQQRLLLVRADDARVWCCTRDGNGSWGTWPAAWARCGSHARCGSRAKRRGSSWGKRGSCCTARPGGTGWAPTARPVIRTSPANRCRCAWWSARCA
jgi:hypothetical protein